MRRFYIDLLKCRQVPLFGLKPLIKIPVDSVTDALSLEKVEFRRIYKSVKPRQDDTLVFICRTGMTANKAIFLVNKIGYKNTFNFHIKQ